MLWSKVALFECSKKAILNGTKAVRGGIPLVFPQFGPGKLTQHGFARTSIWTLHEKEENESYAQCTFKLKDNENIRKQWDYSFELYYTVKLTSDQLITTMRVVNPSGSKSSFEFTALLHTYFNVDEDGIQNSSIDGLKGLSFIDKVDGSQTKTEMDEHLKISQEVDRVYIGAGQVDKIDLNVLNKKKVSIKSSGFNDVVVWNPWVDKSKSMSDFDDSEYKQMICIELGTVNKAITLDVGKIWEASQTLNCFCP